MADHDDSQSTRSPPSPSSSSSSSHQSRPRSSPGSPNPRPLKRNVSDESPNYPEPSIMGLDAIIADAMGPESDSSGDEDSSGGPIGVSLYDLHLSETSRAEARSVHQSAPVAGPSRRSTCSALSEPMRRAPSAHSIDDLTPPPSPRPGHAAPPGLMPSPDLESSSFSSTGSFPTVPPSHHPQYATKRLPAAPITFTNPLILTKRIEVMRRQADEAGVEITYGGPRGRALHLPKKAKPAQVGDVIFRAKPVVAVLSLRYLETHCHGCYLDDVDMSFTAMMQGLRHVPNHACGLCGIVRYCSETCEASDAVYHAEECCALQNLDHGQRPLSDWIPDEPVRALARLLWRRRKERTKDSDPAWWLSIAQMQGTWKNHDPKKNKAVNKGINDLLHFLGAADGNGLYATPEDYGFQTIQGLMDLWFALQVNGFTLPTPALSPIGLAVSPLAAMINHSCAPNAVVVFPSGGRELSVVAMDEIRPGEEILTAYIDMGDAQWARFFDLQDRYEFQCDCPGCRQHTQSIKEVWDPRWVIKHEGCAMNGVLYLPSNQEDSALESRGSSRAVFPSRCNACRMPVPIKPALIIHLDALACKAKTLMALDAADHLGGKLAGVTMYADTADDHEARGMIHYVLDILRARLPNSAYPLNAVLRLASHFHLPPTTFVRWSTSLSLLLEALEGARAIYPEYHPTLGIMDAEMAKLASMDIPPSWVNLALDRMREGWGQRERKPSGTWIKAAVFQLENEMANQLEIGPSQGDSMSPSPATPSDVEESEPNSNRPDEAEPADPRESSFPTSHIPAAMAQAYLTKCASMAISARVRRLRLAIPLTLSAIRTCSKGFGPDGMVQLQLEKMVEQMQIEAEILNRGDAGVEELYPELVAEDSSSRARDASQ